MKTKNKPVILIGSGGHAGVLAEILQANRINTLGIVDPNKKIGDKYFGLEVIGNDSIIREHSPKEILLVNGLGSLPELNTRWEIAKKFRSLKYEFLSLIHLNASVSKDVKIGEGAQIMNGSVIQHGVTIGKDCILNTGIIVDHNCSIGSYSHLAPGCVLSGGVTIGEKVHIGTGSSIIQNIKIGNNVTIAAGSIIHKDINSETTYLKK
jgi:UDP-perosamine 4-acetyltransferase